MIFVFVISYYMAVLDAIPSREGERFLKKKVDVAKTFLSDPSPIIVYPCH